LHLLLTLINGLLSLYGFKAICESLGLGLLVFAFENGLLLIPDSEDVGEGVFLFLSEELVVLLNVEGRLRQQLIHFLLIAC
jgi:hypothetical protein